MEMGEKTKSKRNIIIGILLGAVLITEIALGLWFLSCSNSYFLVTDVGDENGDMTHP